MSYSDNFTNSHSSDSDHEGPSRHDFPAKQRKTLAFFCCYGTFALLFLLATGMAIIALTSHSDISVPRFPSKITSYISEPQEEPNDVSSYTCGSTRLEALAKSCTLDIMADAWLPPACYNSTSASLALEPSTMLSRLTGAGFLDWYRADNHTLPISITEISTLDELTVYTWQVYHLAHCLYSWSTLARAINRVRDGEINVWIHQKLLSEEHVQHCTWIVVGNGGEEGVLRGSKVQVNFALGKCVRLDDERRSSWMHGR